MLRFLSIQNIVLIDNSNIEFEEKGLHIFSGETGSGKSLLLNAIGLAIGKRASSRFIGDQSKKAIICTNFDIANNNEIQKILEENQLHDKNNKNNLNIRRIIEKNSSNKVFINDQLVGTKLHNDIGQRLVEIHGQHDTSGLLSQSNHRKILDKYAKNESLLQELSLTFNEIKNLEKQLKELEEKKNDNILEKDYLEFVINELQQANIEQNEEENLTNIKNSIKNKEAIEQKLSNLKNLNNSINNNSYEAINFLIKSQALFEDNLSQKQRITKISDNLDKISDLTESNINIIQEALNDIDNCDLNPIEIEDRLFAIKNLSRKFNTTSNELHKVLKNSTDKLNMIENQDAYISLITEKIKDLKSKYFEIATKIGNRREKHAKILSKKVEDELKFLKMESVKFQINISKKEVEISDNGFQKISFLASINNKDFDQINKIASGGELSRFMLALKISLIEAKSTPTLIFDEIDTGISGMTADAVGNRLSQLGKFQQVLVVTHQPQIAAKSSTHFCIKKEENKNKIKTTIEKLEEKCKFKEVARMISGQEITNESMAAAKKLFNT